MPDAEITRKQIIVVGEIKGIVGDQYPKWVFTDKEGKEYRVRPDRQKYFDAVVPGQAVELAFASFKGTEYPYGGTAIKDKIEMVEPTHLKPDGGLEPKMTKNDWSEKDRITRKSIERQTSLNAAVEVAKLLGKEITTAKIIATAKLFETYLEGNYLAEEAKKLGAKVVEKGEDSHSKDGMAIGGTRE